VHLHAYGVDDCIAHMSDSCLRGSDKQEHVAVKRLVLFQGKPEPLGYGPQHLQCPKSITRLMHTQANTKDFDLKQDPKTGNEQVDNLLLPPLTRRPPPAISKTSTRSAYGITARAASTIRVWRL
jgi:hypothetical protein